MERHVCIDFAEFVRLTKRDGLTNLISYYRPSRNSDDRPSALELNAVNVWSQVQYRVTLLAEEYPSLWYRLLRDLGYHLDEDSYLVEAGYAEFTQTALAPL
jgi:hypothetical protein